ncbi:MAG: hypothetical protein B6U87_00030 [Candidatus Aenigmarchaeota archaeon ex4484_52]|nr:MAG: hypothetical protein B6U87_00030 [Candidatus Aenigmarchaeota archaeon ex4484_52]
MTKAQLTIKSLAIIAIIFKTFHSVQVSEPSFSFTFVTLEIITPFVLSIAILWLLEKSNF